VANFITRQPGAQLVRNQWNQRSRYGLGDEDMKLPFPATFLLNVARDIRHVAAFPQPCAPLTASMGSEIMWSGKCNDGEG
jgi:hypothetical protein